MAAPSAAFSVSPTSIAPGATLTIRYRIGGRPRRVRVRVDLVPEAGGRPAATLRLGRQRTGPRAARRPGGRSSRPAATPPACAPTTLNAPRRGRRSSSAVEIVAPPVTAAAGVFPVQGAYSLGGDEARFGAGARGPHPPGSGHPRRVRHAGRRPARRLRLLARVPEGRRRPLPRASAATTPATTCSCTCSTARSPSQKGQGVAAGQQLAAVGSTGASDGPAPALRDLARRLVLEQGVAADRPAAGPARLGRRSLEAWRPGPRLPRRRPGTERPRPDGHRGRRLVRAPGLAARRRADRAQRPQRRAGTARRGAGGARARRAAEPADGRGHPARRRRRRLPRGAQAAGRTRAQGRDPERRARRLRGRPRARRDGGRRGARRARAQPRRAARGAARAPARPSCCRGARAARATTPAAAC